METANANTTGYDKVNRVIDSLCDFGTMHHVCPGRRGEGEPLLSNDAVRTIVRLSCGLMFPGFYDDASVSDSELRSRMTSDCYRLQRLLSHQISAALCFADTDCLRTLDGVNSEARRCAEAFIDKLPDLRAVLDTDIDATFLGDPAATSTHEVIVCYPGIRATMSHRIAHTLLDIGVPILPRMIAEQAHSDTGIDIHPGATIGHSFVIDHGTGVVIGATAIIGNNVKIYQGVTLGARSFVKDENNNPVKGIARHPIIGDDVIIYSNSTILGRITVGDGAVIGGNLWVTSPVAAGERLIQAVPENFRKMQPSSPNK
ncbi:MAG: serine acetyltransferase [Muribaculaceae bacterium]|nr:serine acetyltransferase [Muribaculaceae bacterium]